MAAFAVFAGLLCVLIAAFFCVGGFMHRAIARTEPFVPAPDCPQQLVYRDHRFWLMHRGRVVQDFGSIRDYLEYWKRLRRRGSTCPVLYYEHARNGQFRERSLERELAMAIEHDQLARAFDRAHLPPTTPPPPAELPEHVPIRDAEHPNGRPAGLLGTVDSIAQYQGLQTTLTDRAATARSVDRDFPQLGTPGLSADPLHPRFGGPEYRKQLLIDRGYVLNTAT